ncbi:hypothetical protein [Bacillus thuringiensis]|uniref:hypothetical protein n=1 Tax=Bacillus thuringiensis TaxID=1428 RepID=UPI00211D245D|nr:hypothetical protein [Bacillus thuringiensis]MED3269569.1 hypothetical protein [Bacillus thuringiensis]
MSYSDHRYNIKVRINGEYWTEGSVIHNNSSKFRVCFEKLNLPKGTHRVEVTYYGFTTGSNDKSIYTFLSAIDYADFGAKVGDILKQPEPGWKRFDDSDSNIKYVGTWMTHTLWDDGYNKTAHVKNDEQDKLGRVLFNFFGTRLRILAYRTDSIYFDNTKIVIDGTTYNCPKIDKAPNQKPVIVYEILDLDRDKHTVEIYDYVLNLDAIDIDAYGYLLTPAKVGDILKQPEPGWKRFDDTDSNIKYIGNWVAVQNIEDRFNGTLHYKHSSHGTEPIAIEFHFKGTKLRLITLVSKIYDKDLQITIDGVTETFSSSRDTVAAQILTYEKLGLSNSIHTVRITGIYANLDAIDIDDTGELIPIDVAKKPKVSLYEKESGKIFVDDFDSVNLKWLMSPSSAFNNAVKKGFLRMNHSADKDVMLLIDKPQGNFAIQVIAEYAPIKDGDEGGLLLYQNEKNKVEFLESYSANSSQSHKEWMAICKEDQWDFYTKTDTFFDYANNDSLSAERIGVVLKRGTAEGFVPLDINKIIMTTSNMLRLRQLYENYKIVLKDTADNTLSTNIVATAHTGIDILLPSLEFEGIVEIYDEENELLAKKQATFYGGDMYCMGSSLQIKMNSEELNTTDPTNLGYMVNNERIVKMTIVNDNIGAATNIKLSIQQYMEKVGYTWALISLDGTSYLNEIQIDSVAAQSTRDFWVKVVKDTNFLVFEPIYFNVHLKHN